MRKLSSAAVSLLALVLASQAWFAFTALASERPRPPATVAVDEDRQEDAVEDVEPENADDEATAEPEGDSLMPRARSAFQEDEVDLDTRPRTRQGSVILLPPGQPSALLPVVVLLPFTGGDATRMLAWYYRDLLALQAGPEPFLIVVPQGAGSSEDYATGAAWTATLQHYDTLIASDVEELVRERRADPARLVLAGYSMGGDLAWALLQRPPLRYTGAIVMGSRASYRGGKNVFETLRSRGARVVQFMGSDEGEARLAGAAAARAALQKAGVEHRNEGAPGEHVPAPSEIFLPALRYTFALRGQTAATASTVAAPVAVATATGAPIVQRLPTCDWQPFSNTDETLWGFKDAQGKVVVPLRFGHAGEFGALGLAEVLTAEREWGYLGCDGRVFTVASFDTAPDAFREGLARKREGSKSGYVNLRGEFVIAPRYESAAPFCRGLALVGTGCATTFDSPRDEHGQTRCKQRQYIDRQGRIAPWPSPEPDPGRCDVAESQELVEALPGCDWQSFSGKDGNGDVVIGFRDRAGKVRVKPQFTWVGPFADGLAPTLDHYTAGYVGCDGKAFAVRYIDGKPEPFREGLARYEGGSGYDIGFVNRRGQKVIPADYAYATPFCGGIAKAGQQCTIEQESDGHFTNVECGKWITIDRQGRKVADPPGPFSCAGEAW